MPGTLDSSASSLVLNSPDNRQLPAGLTYDALNSTADLTTRERHLGMLLLGLEGKMPTEAKRDRAMKAIRIESVISAKGRSAWILPMVAVKCG